MQVFDRTKEVEDATQPWRGIDKRDPRVCDLVVLHRIKNVDLVELCKLFADRATGTGGRFPYHFLIWKNGAVDQCVPLSIEAPGAGVANETGIQVALAGDFRKAPPTPEQFEALHTLCSDLVRWKPKLRLVGHTEDKARTADDKKICPGEHLVPLAVGLEVARRLEHQAKSVMKVKGVRF